jgi:hypothetical protein
VRAQIAPEDEVLKAARVRRDLVKTEAMKFHGALRAFNSGSVAHATANNPVNDADCGVVLDRRTHFHLGPDGGGVGPTGVVDDIVDLIEPAGDPREVPRRDGRAPEAGGPRDLR